MTMYMIISAMSFVIGCFFGILAMCLCFMGKEEDKRNEIN